MSLYRNLASGVAAGALLLLAAGAASAQDSPSVRKLETQIRQLQQNYQTQIQALQSQVDQL
ncbi:MAG TPA: hypothetical protein VN632_02775, partial [Stellaceae bacterium]|nr:hypothetical protein [Stellaceae bacterium]